MTSFQNSPGSGLSRNTSHAIYTQLHTICINTLTYCTYRAVNIQTEYYRILSSSLIYINFFVYHFYLQDIIYDSEINDIILLIIKTRGYA